MSEQLKEAARAAMNHLRAVADYPGSINDDEIASMGQVANWLEAELQRERRPIQICATHGTREEPDCLYVLCDDGSIWSSWGGKLWRRHSPIRGEHEDTQRGPTT